MSEEKKQTPIEQDLDEVCRALNSPLPAEVVCWAMYAIKANPKLTIKEAIEYGLEEWDC